MSLDLIERAFQAVVPPEPISTTDWFRQNFYTAEGKGFDEYSVPWVTAPGGPCEAVDNPQYRRIWLQWAARMFKTTFAQGVQMKYADVDPSPMMFATVDETLCKQVFGRFWKMIEHCPPIRDQAPPERLQAKTHIGLSRCEVYGAWARGKSRLADKSVRIGHGNEIDKWDHVTTSTEGDPLPRFIKRGDEFPDGIFILESTPAERKQSRIERGRLQSTNCNYRVPCPHCAKFQPLKLGKGEDPPGIFWKRTHDGRNDADLSQKTAYYVCGYCKADIFDIHRPEMMNQGVWVPEGCEVDHDRAMRAREFAPDNHSWLTGEPFRNGQDYGSQISVLYALFHGWGDIASKFLRSKKRQSELRQFVNEDLGETWEVVERKQTWEQVGQRLIVDVPRGVVPTGFSIVTIGADKQKDHYVYTVKALAPGMRSHTLQYGECWPKDEDDKSGGLDALSEILKTQWPHQDGGRAVPLSMALLDSGHWPQGVGKFISECLRSGIKILPCKGASGKLESIFRKSVQGPQTAMPGMLLVLVDAAETQGWMEDVLRDLKPEDPGGMSLYAGSAYDHEEFIEQLLNDGPVDKLDARNNVMITWDRLDDGKPNDYRDCERYALTAGYVALGGKPVPPRVKQAPPPVPKNEEPPRSFIRQPAGKSFIRSR